MTGVKYQSQNQIYNIQVAAVISYAILRNDI